MYIKQLSIFVENKSGRLSEITRLIGQAGIDIRALSVADTADYGVLRLIVDQPDKARDILSKADIASSLTDVIAIGIDDKPGAFANALDVLYKAGISVDYMYAFISRKDTRAYVILRVENNDQAAGVLSDAGVCLLEPQEIYNM